MLGQAAHAYGRSFVQWGGVTTPKDPNHADTSAKEIQRWFQYLTNHINGACCGEGDGYPAEIDIEATPTHPGKGHVSDPSGKEIWVGGYLIKTKPRLVGDLAFEFNWDRVTQERQGNPFDTAYVFLIVRDHGDGTADIARNNELYPDGVYCVAPIPKYY